LYRMSPQSVIFIGRYGIIIFLLFTILLFRLIWMSYKCNNKIKNDININALSYITCSFIIISYLSFLIYSSPFQQSGISFIIFFLSGIVLNLYYNRIKTNYFMIDKII